MRVCECVRARVCMRVCVRAHRAPTLLWGGLPGFVVWGSQKWPPGSCLCPGRAGDGRGGSEVALGVPATPHRPAAARAPSVCGRGSTWALGLGTLARGLMGTLRHHTRSTAGCMPASQRGCAGPRLSGLHLVTPTPPRLWGLVSTALEPSASSSAVTPLVCWPFPSPALFVLLFIAFYLCFSVGCRGGGGGRGVGSTPACPVYAKSELPFRGGCLCILTCSHSLGTRKGDTCSFMGGKCPPAFLKAPAIGTASQCQVASLSHASSPGLFLPERRKGGCRGAGSVESLLGLWGKRGVGEGVRWARSC